MSGGIYGVCLRPDRWLTRPARWQCRARWRAETFEGADALMPRSLADWWRHWGLAKAATASSREICPPKTHDEAPSCSARCDQGANDVIRRRRHCARVVRPASGRANQMLCRGPLMLRMVVRGSLHFELRSQCRRSRGTPRVQFCRRRALQLCSPPSSAITRRISRAPWRTLESRSRP